MVTSLGFNHLQTVELNLPADCIYFVNCAEQWRDSQENYIDEFTWQLHEVRWMWLRRQRLGTAPTWLHSKRVARSRTDPCSLWFIDNLTTIGSSSCGCTHTILTARYTLLTVWHPLLTAWHGWHLLLTARYPLLTTRHSPLIARHRALVTARNSPLTARHVPVVLRGCGVSR